MSKTSTQTLQFALCLDNEGYPASLEVGKVYRVIPDKDATTHGYIRVIDEKRRKDVRLYSQSLLHD